MFGAHRSNFFSLSDDAGQWECHGPFWDGTVDRGLFNPTSWRSFLMPAHNGQWLAEGVPLRVEDARCCLSIVFGWQISARQDRALREKHKSSPRAVWPPAEEKHLDYLNNFWVFFSDSRQSKDCKGNTNLFYIICPKPWQTHTNTHLSYYHSEDPHLHLSKKNKNQKKVNVLAKVAGFV